MEQFTRKHSPGPGFLSIRVSTRHKRKSPSTVELWYHIPAASSHVWTPNCRWERSDRKHYGWCFALLKGTADVVLSLAACLTGPLEMLLFTAQTEPTVSTGTEAQLSAHSCTTRRHCQDLLPSTAQWGLTQGMRRGFPGRRAFLTLQAMQSQRAKMLPRQPCQPTASSAFNILTAI